MYTLTITKEVELKQDPHANAYNRVSTDLGYQKEILKMEVTDEQFDVIRKACLDVMK